MTPPHGPRRTDRHRTRPARSRRPWLIVALAAVMAAPMSAAMGLDPAPGAEPTTEAWTAIVAPEAAGAIVATGTWDLTNTEDLEVTPAPPPPTAAELAEARVSGGAVAQAQQYANGRIPSSALCELSFSPGSHLRCDAAASLERLVERGMPTGGIVSSYRTFASQSALASGPRAAFAAPAGYSEHGRGVAVDFGGATLDWIRTHAGTTGWAQPAWATPRGSLPEAWHWEFQG